MIFEHDYENIDISLDFEHVKLVKHAYKSRKYPNSLHLKKMWFTFKPSKA